MVISEWGGRIKNARTAIVYVLTLLQIQNLGPTRTNLSFPLLNHLKPIVKNYSRQIQAIHECPLLDSPDNSRGYHEAFKGRASIKFPRLNLHQPIIENHNPQLSAPLWNAQEALIFLTDGRTLMRVTSSGMYSYPA